MRKPAAAAAAPADVDSERTTRDGMSTLKTLLFVGLITLLAAGLLPARSQNNGYQSSFGKTRVVRQSQNGLSAPSPTYVDSSMSGTAKGAAAGIGSPLPDCNTGSHIRTPGDNLYNQAVRAQNGAVMYKDQAAQINARKKIEAAKRAAAAKLCGARTSTAKPPRYYVPGQNGAAAQIGNGAPYAVTSPATYGDLPATGKRQF